MRNKESHSNVVSLVLLINDEAHRQHALLIKPSGNPRLEHLHGQECEILYEYPVQNYGKNGNTFSIRTIFLGKKYSLANPKCLNNLTVRTMIA